MNPMSDLTGNEREILKALNSVFDRIKFIFGEEIPVCTWHIRHEMNNKFTSPQIRETLKFLDVLGLVSGKKDGNNIVWIPLKESNND